MPLEENKKCRQSCLTNAPAGISYKIIIGQTIYYKSFELDIPDVLVCFESFKTTDALAVDCDIAESYSVNASFFRISCHYRRIQFEETSFVGNIFKRDVADAASRHTIVLFVEKNVEIYESSQLHIFYAYVAESDILNGVVVTASDGETALIKRLAFAALKDVDVLIEYIAEGFALRIHVISMSAEIYRMSHVCPQYRVANGKVG